MTSIRKLFGAERRIDTRFRVNFQTRAEHSVHGDLQLHMTNLSARGCMCEGPFTPSKGDPLLVELPVVVRRSAFVSWVFDGRFGAQFHNPLPDPELSEILNALNAQPLLP